MFKYIIIGILAYWISKRVFRVSRAVKNDGNPQTPPNANHRTTVTKETKAHNHGGEYVDYEEID